MLLYKFRGPEQLEFLLDILLNERLYCADYQSLNDPFEGQAMPKPRFGTIRPLLKQLTRGKSGDSRRHEMAMAKKTLRRMLRHVPRVCSLSMRNDDVRMWSLYGGSHRGFAVELDFPPHSVPKAVAYLKPGDPKLHVAHPWSADEALTVKSNHWSYETEFRILTPSTYFDASGMIRRVLAGPRASNDHIRLIEKATGRQVPVVRMRLDPLAVTVVEA